MAKSFYIDDIGNGPTGRSPEQTALLKRVFQGMEVRDATADLIIIIKEEDYVGAIPRDMEHCGFANCGRRLYNSSTMVFMNTVAYVEIPDEDGVRRVLRFSIGSKMQGAIKVLDESNGTKHVTGTFVLKAPRMSHKLDTLMKYSRKQAKKPGRAQRKRTVEKQRKVAIKSKATVVKTRNRAGVAGIVRSGTGLIQTVVR
jgi:hypothetical protein